MVSFEAVERRRCRVARNAWNEIVKTTHILRIRNRKLRPLRAAPTFLGLTP
jgi:hypothetical protein